MDTKNTTNLMMLRNSGKARSSIAREVHEFAPGLLAIQESPPPRLPRTVFVSVVALFAILLAWASFGQLDVVATAEGKLVPLTHIKIVQPAEGGIVREILVDEGDEVDADQILMRMDANIGEADARAIKDEHELKRLQLRRIDAELTNSPMEEKAEDQHDLFVRISQQHKAHRRAYFDAIAQENALKEKAQHELLSAKEALRKLNKTIPYYRSTAEAFERLSKDNYVGPLVLEEKRRDLIEKEQDLKAQRAAVLSLEAAISAAEQRINHISSSYLSGLENERVETESQLIKLREELRKIQHKNGLLTLRSPQRGTIKDLATHTRGTVVSPGTVLMSLVPHGEPLKAEVLVRNEDAGFVREGLLVKVKVAAYPFQKYGFISGTVSRVGPDATDPIPSNAEPLSETRYKASVKLDSQHIHANGNILTLTSGMQVIVDIHLGRRTVMEYLLSPVQKAWQEAGRER